MPNLSIKNVSAEIVSKLRDRAAANHRSLQGELLALITREVEASPSGKPELEVEIAERRMRKGHKSIEQIAAEHLARVRQPILRGGRSVDIVRADRDAR